MKIGERPHLALNYIPLFVNRIKKNLIKIIYGIIIGVIFHFLSDIVKTFGQTGALNIFLSVWSIPIIFNLVLVSTLIHLEDG